MVNQSTDSCILDISDEDILKAMKDIDGYLDITPRDFKEVYLFAYRHAVERLTHTVTAGDIMTRAVIYVEKDTPLEDVADKLSLHLVSGLPVVDSDKKVVGIISESVCGDTGGAGRSDHADDSAPDQQYSQKPAISRILDLKI